MIAEKGSHHLGLAAAAVVVCGVAFVAGVCACVAYAWCLGLYGAGGGVKTRGGAPNA